MGTYTSGEDLIIKTRKPYTITKQRERWTEEEHNRFLEALKLYGRAWQRIEEHIGTKTAVQIRSHAQKFFSKLEKEALIKGIPLGQTLDIDIPPPRPKRKPSNPYPRKTSLGAPTSSSVGAKDGKLLTSASTLYRAKQIPYLENDPPPEKPAGTEKLTRAEETLDEDNCLEVPTLYQEAPCASISSASKSSTPTSVVLTNSCSFREFVPSLKEISDHGAMDESYLTVEPKGNQKLDRSDANYTDLENGMSEAPNMENGCHNSHEKLVHGERADELKQPEKLGLLSTDEIQANQNYPRHVPVHIVDGSSGTCTQTQSPDMMYPSSIIQQMGGAHENPNLLTNPTASTTTEHHSNMSRSSIHQSLPNFPPPFTPLHHNQDTYRSFLNISPTFSSFVLSTLLQNPAAHVAANLTTSLWPWTNLETSVGSPVGTLGGFPLGHISPSPNMTAIAAATVTAASAWWAAHGLLPLCLPHQNGFTCAPAPTIATPTDAGQVPMVNKERKDSTPQDPPWKGQLVLESSEAPKPQCSVSKPPPLSSSDTEESGAARSDNAELKAVGHEQKPAPVTDLHDSNKVKTTKPVDRSSCGSNTTSSSEVETNALEKHEKGKEESKEADASNLSGEPNNRRSRSTSNMNEAWKEVSEEGRLAFQALFNREVLPQSFPTSHDLRNKGQHKNSIEEVKQKSTEKDKDTLQLDLNNKTWENCPNHPGLEKSELLSSENAVKGLLFMGLGHGKLKTHRTGFKPYKRCSMEANESRVTNGSIHGEEKGLKRIRLEGEAST